MPTTIGLISDVHATLAPVEEALALFSKHNVDLILCAGDIAGYGVELEATIERLINARCISILGNHDEWFLFDNQNNKNNFAVEYLSQLPSEVELKIETRKLYMVHTSPFDSQSNGIRLLDEYARRIDDEIRYWDQYLNEFDFDVLVVGHTHQTYAEQLGNSLVINPGSSKFNHACAILSLPDMTVEFFPLSGKKIQPVWSWREMIQGKNTD